MFGVDWNGPLPSSSTNCVIVEPPPSPLSQQDFRQLCHLINPLDPCQDYGIQLFLDCVDFISSRV